MAKRVFPDKFKASKVKVKSRIDRGKQLEYEIYHNFERTRSLKDGKRVLRKGEIATPPEKRNAVYIDPDSAGPLRISTSPTKVLTTEGAQKERSLTNAPNDFWAGSSSIAQYTTWTYRVMEKKGEAGELRLHFSKGRFLFVRVYAVLKTIQYSTATDKETALLRYQRGAIFWAGTRKFK